MPDKVPCPKCGRLYVWDGTRCCHKECRFGSNEEPVQPIKKIPPEPPPSFDERWRHVIAMSADMVDRILNDLAATRYGWRAMVPVDFGAFFGVAIAIEVHTRLYPEKDPPPEVNDHELALARQVLSHLIPVLQEAERNFEKYNTEIPEAMSLVFEPHIWITRDDGKGVRPNEWTLVVGVKESPDFGFHIEFEGLKYQDIWAGD